MHLTPREEERLLIAAGADLARRRIARGAQLGATDAIALVSDAVLEAAWDGATLDAAIEVGKAAVPPHALLPGTASLVPQVQVEALFPHGSVLVVVPAPFGPPEPDGPGAVRPGTDRRALAPGRRRSPCTIHNAGRDSIWISSHAPLDALNDAITIGGLPDGRWRLDVPAGISRRIDAGEQIEVTAVEMTGEAP
ncbi:urease subunit gamma [Mobilicoccus caccae]|nr:urease subunit gamma [Mobilicoccus caccae]